MVLIHRDWKIICEGLKPLQQKFLFFFLFVILFGIYAVFTDIVVVFPGPIGLNPDLNWINVALIFFITLTASLSLVITFFYPGITITQTPKKGLFGGILGIFATACPICQPIWLVWLGLGSASVVLIDYSTPIALVSLALVLYSLDRACLAVDQKTCLV